MPARSRLLPAAVAALLLVLSLAVAPLRATADDAPPPPERAAARRDGPAPVSGPVAAHYPPESVVHHSLALPGRSLAFTTTAGVIAATDAGGQKIADIAFAAYTLDGADRAVRPVTFVFNGGPGMATGWLQAGAVGPWIVPIGGAAMRPSAAAAPGPNPDTWLDFTDLVFIDPAGTGYSRAAVTGDDARRELFSVDGDIAYLAQVVRRWLDRTGRIVSPKFILGESYGGFRAPLLARALQHDQGVGVSRLILLSPALDFGGRSRALDPLSLAIRLPSMAAVARTARLPPGATLGRADLSDAEEYAAGEFVTDLLRGVRDEPAVARIVQRVAALTGLDAALVQRYRGRIDTDVFLHDADRAAGRVASPYDATVTSPDPFPLEPYSEYEEPVVQALLAPITGAMVALYGDELHWQPDVQYQLSNSNLFRNWDWGRRMSAGAQSVTALRTALALDPQLRVLIAHGMFDLVTPYFGTALILREIPDIGPPGRIRLAVYPGGHMFYTRDDARAAFRADAIDMLARQ